MPSRPGDNRSVRREGNFMQTPLDGIALAEARTIRRSGRHRLSRPRAACLQSRRNKTKIRHKEIKTRRNEIQIALPSKGSTTAGGTRAINPIASLGRRRDSLRALELTPAFQPTA